VVAVDTASGEIVAAAELGSKPAAVAAADDAVWVGDALDGVVTRLDPRSGKVVKSIGIGAPAVDVAVGLGAVWVATGSSGTIVRVDPEIGAVVDRINLAAPDAVVVPDAAGVAVGQDGMLWVASAEGVLRVNPETKRIRRIDVGATRVVAVAPVGRAVWANVVDGRTLRLETGPGTPTAEFSGPEAGPLAADADGVWISSVDSLVSLDPEDASLMGAVPAGGFVIGIAPDGDTVWAAVLQKQALLRVDARSLEVEQAIPLGGYPLAVAVDAARVWVCVVKEDPSE
jgi:streptogramin lyase